MRLRFGIVAIVTATVAVIGLPAPSAATAQRKLATPAWFEGHWIDLARSWEEATACDVGAEATLCFRSEAEMDAVLGAETSSEAGPLLDVAPLSSCASSLRLYDGASYSGTVLSLSTRLTYLNLSSYSFDNLTSSYKVGACDVDMFANASGGGGVYPGNTAANVQAASMTSGWNNVVSSVYIY